MALPEITPGSTFRLPLPDRSRTTGGAFQIWRGLDLLYQGSQYGGPAADPAPGTWRPVGLVQTAADGVSILLYVPTDALPGEYELRLATTQGSRSGHFIVKAA